MDDEEPKPVRSGVFGNIYNQFKGKVKEAFDFLMKHKGGDLLGVFHRKDVGDIDLVWGDENGGLAHILHKHVGEGKSFANVDEAMSHIQNIIETGKNDFEDGDKIVFRNGSELVTVRKNFREGGKKIADKNWILTAYARKQLTMAIALQPKSLKAKLRRTLLPLTKVAKSRRRSKRSRAFLTRLRRLPTRPTLNRQLQNY